ncbi:NAD(P)-dependent alcohol dehydrogenase [Saccharothrix longispora]|uniref:NADPH:quinone reductase-like Zn-dependent oxidoreductase n=1 Tax=Saccharothrix longispora TaxID=33920 RepID=A0ABU1Q3Y5_9PSEU|nr:NAD(P)-dependent alcohol dehydrogenase [Saccharothrix longispora]MDR6597573.1 NADPH:quinone reductase-like Zn-dependent oxidoreductase [Saccharothrix longispora]
MRAVVQRRYGDPAEVLRVEDVERPTAGDGEVLVRVLSAPVSGSDWHILRGLPYAARPVVGVRRPRGAIAGIEMAGVVEAVGPGVTAHAVGDEVFGWCDGAFAEYVAVPADQVARRPANLTAEQAGALPIAGFTALQAVRDKGRVTAGTRVLITGATGCVGTYAVQIAKALGAEVTAVCGAAKADLAKALGADHVHDYATGGLPTGFDVLVDLYGNPSARECAAAVRRGGTVVLTGGTGGRWFMGLDRWLRVLAAAPLLGFRATPLVHADRLEDLVALRDLVEAGDVTPVIARTYPLDGVARAVEDVRRGRVRGQAVVTP